MLMWTIKSELRSALKKFLGFEAIPDGFLEFLIQNKENCIFEFGKESEVSRKIAILFYSF